MDRFGRVIAIVMCLVICSRALAAFPPNYTLTNLGVVPGGSGTIYSGTGLNASGQVCGWGDGAFLWTPTSPNGTAGSMIDLGNLPTATGSQAFGINNYGQVVGRSLTHNAPGRTESAFLWTPTTPNGTTGSMVDISKPTGSGDEGNSINALGQVAGETSGGSAEFLWTPTTPNATTGSMTFPGTLPNTEESYPGKINARGQIPGSSYGSDALYHANLWSPTTPNSTTGSMIGLGDLSGGNNQSYADSVNSAGKVVGAGTNATAQHATLWTPTTPNGMTGSLTDLQSLVSASNKSRALDINNSDLIVGWTELSVNVNHATLWTADGPVDLNSLISGDNGGWLLRSANGINDLGQILCDGRLGNMQHAILLTPVVPEPGVTGLFAAGMLFLYGPRRSRNRWNFSTFLRA